MLGIADRYFNCFTETAADEHLERHKSDGYLNQVRWLSIFRFPKWNVCYYLFTISLEVVATQNTELGCILNLQWNLNIIVYVECKVKNAEFLPRGMY